MRIVPLLILSLSLALPQIAGAQAADPSVCFLMSVQLGRAPVQRTRPFKRAFQHVRKARWAKAAASFSEAMRAIQDEAIGFHVGEDVEPDLSALQAFLERHVYDPVPTVNIQGDDFQFVPLVLLSAARAHCEIGEAPRGLNLLYALDNDAHPALRRSRATLALATGDGRSALAHLGSDLRDLDERLVQVLAHARVGERELAASKLETLQGDCIGPSQCGRVRRVSRIAIPKDAGAP